ncbi:MAG: lipopolysaccharide biosynthesis protein [Acidobacteriaceae bacterium]|nr:lipopolysaccharide biosynthesis protein [Acidobacteriaceae bacterium]
MPTLWKNSLWSAAAAASLMVPKFMASAMVARILGPQMAGDAAYLLWVADFAIVAVGFGIPSAVTRFSAMLRGSAGPNGATHLERVLVRAYIRLVLMGGILLFACKRWWMPPNLPTGSSEALLAYFFLQSLAVYNLARFGGEERFQALAKISAVSGTISVVAAIVGAYWYHIPGALTGYAVGAAVLGGRAILAALPRARSSEKLSRGLITELCSYCRYAWISAILAGVVWARVEIFFLERFRTNTDVAFFSVGATLAATATQAPLLLCGALTPHFARNFGLQNDDGLRSDYIKSTRLLATVLFPSAFCWAACAPTIIKILYGPAFVSAIPTAMVQVALACIVALITPASALLYASGRPAFHVAVNAPIALACILVSRISIGTWGVWGAVWQRAACQLTVAVLTVAYVHGRLGFRFPIWDCMRLLLAASVPGIPLLLVSPHLGPAAVVVATAMSLLGYLFAMNLVAKSSAEQMIAITRRFITESALQFVGRAGDRV